MALASSSASGIVNGTLAILGFQDRFEVIVSGEMAAASKPAPDIFLLAAQRLGVQPGECVVVEDSPRGVEGAKRAGMFVVAVRTAPVPESELSGADRVISSLGEFPLAGAGARLAGVGWQVAGAVVQILPRMVVGIPHVGQLNDLAGRGHGFYRPEGILQYWRAEARVH